MFSVEQKKERPKYRERIEIQIRDLIENRGYPDKFIENMSKAALELAVINDRTIIYDVEITFIRKTMCSEKQKYCDRMNREGKIKGSALKFLYSFIKSALKRKTKQEILDNITLFCRDFSYQYYRLNKLDIDLLEATVRSELSLMDTPIVKDKNQIQK